MAWMTNHYECANCGTRWEDEWSCGCDDECPTCHTDMSPHDSTDLTVRVERDGGMFTVMVSPPTAGDRPQYEEHYFTAQAEADAFAERKRTELAEAA